MVLLRSDYFFISKSSKGCGDVTGYNWTRLCFVICKEIKTNKIQECEDATARKGEWKDPNILAQ